jgi:hypothetical protein
MHPHGGLVPETGTLPEDDVRVWYVFSDKVRDPHLPAQYAAVMTQLAMRIREPVPSAI